MPALLSFVLKIAAFFFSSFIFWRKLRDDYAPGKIFSFTLVLFLGVVAGSLLVRYLPVGESGLATFSFWLPFFLIVLLTLYLVRKLDFRLFEVLDSLVPASLFFLLIYSLAVVGNFERESLVEAGLAFVGLLIFHLLKGRYRKFSWYPSGKVGFLGLVTLALYFFARFLIAILFPLDLASAIISLVLSLFFIFAVYLRSGRANAEKLVIKWQK